MNSTPHLTPASLVGRSFASNSFPGVTVALVGYCPRPRSLDKYQPKNTRNQYFIHVPPGSVQICVHRGVRFLSIAHVYGGPVSAALIEELAYYGVKTVLAYGLAGGLGTKGLTMGDFYQVACALAMDGTTPHYSSDAVIPSDKRLNGLIRALAKQKGLPKITPVQAWTSDAIYREYDEKLAHAQTKGCDIVNCDSSHLFAVSRAVGIRSIQCGVVSDVVNSGGGEWDSKLSAMLSTRAQSAEDPMALVGKIATFYVETMMPALGRRGVE